MLKKTKELFEELYQPDLELPESLKEEYELLSCMKYTEQKQVYLLRKAVTGELAVLKCGFGMYRRVLKEEYRLLLHLNRMKEKGFPKLLAWKEESEACMLIREYVEGDTLQELMEKETVLTNQEALDAAVQVSELLCCLHQQNPPVIYRDVKPQNIVRTPEGNFVLIDLDTARIYKDGVGEDTVFMGTRGFASPEQFGFHQTDVRTDVYGFGMLFLYLMTGVYEKNKKFETLPKQIKKIIEKCTEFNPKDRYPSIKEAEQMILRFQKRMEWQESLRKQNRRIHKLLLPAFLLILAGGICASIFWMRYDRNVVEFSNPVIEQAVREKLRKTDGSNITREDLDSIYTLIICGERTFSSWTEKEEYLAFNWYVTNYWTQPEEPFDMSDLSMFTNINTLVIEYQNVTEIPDLSHLPLVRVDFSNNWLTDVSGISECMQIKTLYLKNNPVSDISALKNLEQLEELDISCTQVSDLSPVVSDKLKALYLEYTGIEDFSVLEECPSLEDIRVSNASKEEIRQLLCIKNLKNFSVYEGEVDSLEMFHSVPGLYGLELAGCEELTSLDGIEVFTELVFLGLSGTGIQSFPEHFYHDTLEVLEVTGTGIKDFKALLRCPRLRNLYVSAEVEGTASMQLEQSNITVSGIK